MTLTSQVRARASGAAVESGVAVAPDAGVRDYWLVTSTGIVAPRFQLLAVGRQILGPPSCPHHDNSRGDKKRGIYTAIK